jgi:vancomycin permeability regulator SanA
MRDALVAHGVDPAAIVEDGRGRRTLDSMARASAVFGYRAALVVTNDFHVPRAVYLGQHFGLDVHGVAADAGVERPLASTLRNLGREVLARALAVVDCHLLGTAPESLER